MLPKDYKIGLVIVFIMIRIITIIILSKGRSQTVVCTNVTSVECGYCFPGLSCASFHLQRA